MTNTNLLKYHFADLAELAAHFKQTASARRQTAKSYGAGNKRSRQRELTIEASVYESVAAIVGSSALDAEQPLPLKDHEREIIASALRFKAAHWDTMAEGANAEGVPSDERTVFDHLCKIIKQQADEARALADRIANVEG